MGIRASWLIAVALAASMSSPARPAQIGREGSDSLPYQYIYLADFSRMRHLAEKGDPEALFQLGLMHYDPPESSGVAQSYRRAFLLFFEAALRGHITAQHNVGAMYWNGDYVAQNVVEGYAWFEVAAKAGEPAGLRKMKQHASDLSAEQFDAVRTRVQQVLTMLENAKQNRQFEPLSYGIR